MRTWLELFIAALCIIMMTHNAGGSETASPQPNFLFIITDDQAIDTLGDWGYPHVHTPHMDRLSRLGVNFMRAYNPGSWSPAVCMPSRTMLLSGLTLWRAREADHEGMMHAQQWWPQIMRQAGYETYMTGKWHVRPRPEDLFDHVSHVRGGMPESVPEAYNRPLEDRQDPWSASDRSIGGFWAGGRHWSEVVADDVQLFLDRAAVSDKPFFMYVAFNAPHDPRQSPVEYLDMYPLDAVPLPENFQSRYAHAEAIGAPHGLRDERLAPMPRTEHAVKVHRREYYALVSHLDAQIGRILEALEQSGKAENTYIILTSDHGLAVGRHGLFGKQNLYEHSVRVPLIVVGPGMEAGRRIQHRVYLQDIVPTVIELAAQSIPEHVGFRSLLPLIRHDTNEHYDAIYGAYRDLQRMVIQDDWKLLMYPNVPCVRLFNLADDPLEMNDLADDPNQQARIGKLLQSLRTLQIEWGDALDLSAIFERWMR